MIKITIDGAEHVATAMRLASEGAAAAARTSVLVGSQLPYAFGIVTGTHRSGVIARQAGGTMSLFHALDAIQPRIGRELATAIPKGGPATVSAMTRLGLMVETGTKSREVVKTGSLRRSYHTVTAAR